MRRVLVRLAVLLGLVGALGTALAVYDRPPVAPGTWLAAAGLEARHETVDGHRLRYVRSGSGPAVVLVHGFGSSLYTWKDVIPALAASHDVVALDLPGFGESDLPAKLSFEDLPRAVVGLMDALGIARATLVGNSMGGATAAVVAARAPGPRQGLVLIDAAGFNLAPSEHPGMVSLTESCPGSGALPPAGEAPAGGVVPAAGVPRPGEGDPRAPVRIPHAALRPGTMPAIRSLGSLAA